jgi:hypothetical protein
MLLYSFISFELIVKFSCMKKKIAIENKTIPNININNNPHPNGLF